MNFYEYLGVPRDASAAEIKSAYRKHAKEWHPDRNRHPEAAERFRLYTEVYEILSNPERRAGYDERLRQADQGFDPWKDESAHEAQAQQAEPPPPSPLEQLLDQWDAKLTLDPAMIAKLFARIDAWLQRVMARNARRHS